MNGMIHKFIKLVSQSTRGWIIVVSHFSVQLEQLCIRNYPSPLCIVPSYCWTTESVELTDNWHEDRIPKQIYNENYSWQAQLKTLDLSENQIAEISDGSFDSNAVLALLDISDNRLVNMRKQSFQFLASNLWQTSQVDAYANELDCASSQMAEFRSFMNLTYTNSVG